MPWWSMVQVAEFLISEAPQLAADLKDIIERIHAVAPATQDQIEALPQQVQPGGQS